MVKTNGWETHALRDLVRPHLTVDPKKEPHVLFHYIDISSIDNASHRIITPKELLGQNAPSRARRLVQTGDVLFSTVRPYLKNIALVPEEMSGYLTSTGICVLRPGPELDPKFLFYAVRRDEFVETLSKSMDGSLYPAVRDSDVLDMEIPCPPLDQQRRIVARIEEMLERSRRARGALGFALEDAEHLKIRCLEGAYHEASENASSLVAFGSVLEDIRGGTTQVPSDEVSPGKVLRSSAVRPGAIDWNDVRYLKDIEKVNPHHWVQEGDLLITRLSGSLEYVGNMAMAKGVGGRRIAYPDRLFRARLRPGHVGEFYTLLFSSPSVRRQLEPAAKSSAGHQRISISNVEDVILPLCPEHIQRAIAEGTLSKLQRIDAMLSTAALAHQQLDLIEQAVLSAAFSGTV